MGDWVNVLSPGSGWPDAPPTTPWEMTVAPQPQTPLEPEPVPAPALPSTVWVAVVTVITEVLVRTPTVNTGNKSMGMGGLFAGVTKGGTTAQEHSAARVCGVAGTEDEARALLELWKARNSQVVTGDTMVVQVPFGLEADIGLEEASTRQCNDCGTVITMGNRCRACTDKWAEAMKAKDADVLQQAFEQAEQVRNKAVKRSALDEWKERVGQ